MHNNASGSHAGSVRTRWEATALPSCISGQNVERGGTEREWKGRGGARKRDEREIEVEVRGLITKKS